jgi:hypothetical protein
MVSQLQDSMASQRAGSCLFASNCTSYASSQALQLQVIDCIQGQQLNMFKAASGQLSQASSHRMHAELHHGCFSSCTPLSQVGRAPALEWSSQMLEGLSSSSAGGYAKSLQAYKNPSPCALGLWCCLCEKPPAYAENISPCALGLWCCLCEQPSAHGLVSVQATYMVVCCAPL